MLVQTRRISVEFARIYLRDDRGSTSRIIRLRSRPAWRFTLPNGPESESSFSSGRNPPRRSMPQRWMIIGVWSSGIRNQPAKTRLIDGRARSRSVTRSIARFTASDFFLRNSQSYAGCMCVLIVGFVHSTLEISSLCREVTRLLKRKARRLLILDRMRAAGKER